MKTHFFAFFMGLTSLLAAHNLESIDFENSSINVLQSDLEENPPFFGNELESRRRHHGHHVRHTGIVYASFYAESTGTTAATDTVSPGFPVVFNRTSVASSDIDLLAGGRIRINQAGDYLINFGISASPSLSMIDIVEIALALNGVLQPGSDISTTESGQLYSASTILHIPTAPAILSMVNQGMSDIVLDTPTDGTVAAFITIDKLQHKSK